jgi:hypothetical protein
MARFRAAIASERFRFHRRPASHFLATLRLVAILVPGIAPFDIEFVLIVKVQFVSDCLACVAGVFLLGSARLIVVFVHFGETVFQAALLLDPVVCLAVPAGAERVVEVPFPAGLSTRWA